MAIVTENRKKTHWSLVSLLAIMAIGGLAFKFNGTITNWFTEFFYSGPASQKSESTVTDNQSFFESEIWNSLTPHGRLPIVAVPGEAGRANPFQPFKSALDTAEGRDAARANDTIILAAALGRYREDMGRYPLGQALVLGGPETFCLAKDGWLGEKACVKTETPYLKPVPKDPGSEQYLYTSDGVSYIIKGRLETSRGTLTSWQYSVPAP